MRMIAWLALTLAIAGCASRDGRDGMDGFGVATGLRHELQRADR